MASTLNPAVPVMLDKERHLIFDLNANIAFQEKTGRQLIEVIAEIAKSAQPAEGELPKGAPVLPPLDTIRAILWAGLISETLDEDCRETSETLSVREVGALLNLGSLVELMNQIGVAFAAAMPQPKDEPAARPTRAPARKHARSTGATSGASPIAISASAVSRSSGD